MTPKKVAGFALGPIGGAILGFITLPIITWYFPQEDIGRLAMLSVVTSFCTLLFSLGLDQAYVREFHETQSKHLLFKLALLPGLLLLLFTLAILLSFDNVISLSLFDLESKILSFLVALVILFSFIGRFLSLILRMNEKALAFSISQILPKFLLLLVIASYVVFSANKNITNLVWANVAATSLVCIAYGCYTRQEWLAGLQAKIDFTYLKNLLSFGVPLIFGGLAFWGLTATDKVLLKELSNFDELALYSVAVNFAAAATIFQSIFTTIWAPLVYKWAATGEGHQQIQKVNRYVLIAVIALFCGAGLFSWMVTLILPHNYSAVQWILISCLGMPLLYTLSETTVVGIGVTRRSSYAMLAALLAFIVNLFGNWWLIPIFGGAGAAVSTCISFWAFFILRTEFAIYVWKPLDRKHMYAYTSFLVFGAVISSLYGQKYFYVLVTYWLVVLLSVVFVFKTERQEIQNWIVNRFT